MKGRIYELDIIRSIACIMVITMHSPMPSEEANGMFLSSLSYLTAPCIGLFFMVSGSLLLPVHEDSISFVKKRLSKVIWPTLFWSIFYLWINFMKGETNNHSYKEWISILFSAQGNSILWFMYTLIGIYLVLPIISKWLLICTKKELEFYLLLWGISMCYPILKLFLFINQSETGILYYCSGYIGYFLLGYYMKKFSPNITWKNLLPLCILSILTPIICKLLNWKVDFYSIFWYLSIFIVFICVGWFKFIIDYGNRILKFQKIRLLFLSFSNLSFGIYLIHAFILRSILWNQTWIRHIDNYIAQCSLLIILTTVLSYLLCYLLSYLPIAEYLIGYKRKL